MIQSVYLLVQGKAVGYANVFYKIGCTEPLTVLHGSELETFQREDEELIVVNSVQIYKESFDTPYPYRFKSFDDIPKVLGDMNTLEFFKTSIAWDRSQMKHKAEVHHLSSAPQIIYKSSEKLLVQTPQTKRSPVRGELIYSVREHKQKRASNGDAQHSEENLIESNDVDGEQEDYEIYGSRDDDQEMNSRSTSDTEIPSYSPGPVLRHEGATSNYEEYDEIECQPPQREVRRYRYRNRKKGNKPSISAMRSARQAEAQRKDNPFLISRHCCSKSQCFDKVDPHYAFDQYKRILVLDGKALRRKLESWLDSTTMQFMFNGNAVCYRFLCLGFKFSFYLISNIKGTPMSRPPPGTLPAENNKMTKRDSIAAFISNYADTMGDKMPNAPIDILPITKKIDLYSDYVSFYRKYHENKIQAEARTKSYFLRIWKRDLKNVKARKTRGFTKCSLCEKYRCELLECNGNEAKIKAIREAKHSHLQFMRRERMGYYNRRDRASRTPKRYCSFIIDGADQKSYGLPHFVFSTKDDRGHKMKVKCVGVLEHQMEKNITLFPFTEEFQTGSNHVVEALHRVLDKKYHEEGSLPRTMYVQLDNCGRENKNHYFLSYLESLVGFGIFQEVQASLLPVGHTHEDIDQVFSSLSRHLRNTDAHTMTELVQEMKNTWKKDATVAQMTSMINYSGLCDAQKCIQRVQGISQYRYFRFTRKNDGEASSQRQGLAHCNVKRALDDDWIPLSETVSGILKEIPVFDSAPALETNPPANEESVLKCLSAAESRIKSSAKMNELRKLHSTIYTKRFERLHWDLDSCFELSGNSSEQLNENSEFEDNEMDSDGSDTLDYDSFDYDAGSFLAVKACNNSPFWICQVKRVVQNRKAIEVLWYEGYSAGGKDDPYSDLYKPIHGAGDTISVDTIHMNFDRLTKSGALRVNVVNALRQVLQK